MRSTASSSPAYRVLLDALKEYCNRKGIDLPKNDKGRARILKLNQSWLSRIRNGHGQMSEETAAEVSRVLCVDESARLRLISALRSGSVRQVDNSNADTSPTPTPEAFVRRFGVNGAVLLVEMADVWPYTLELEGMFSEGLNAGMSVILFVPHMLRCNRRSMSDRMVDISVMSVLSKLSQTNAERVALYHLVENTCPAPPIGVRITGLLPNRPPESRWLIADGLRHHFIPTSRNPHEILSFFLGMGTNTHAMPPTQENLESTWISWRHTADLPDERPCPIRRWIAK